MIPNPSEWNIEFGHCVISENFDSKWSKGCHEPRAVRRFYFRRSIWHCCWKLKNVLRFSSNRRNTFSYYRKSQVGFCSWQRNLAFLARLNSVQKWKLPTWMEISLARFWILKTRFHNKTRLIKTLHANWFGICPHFWLLNFWECQKRFGIWERKLRTDLDESWESPVWGLKESDCWTEFNSNPQTIKSCVCESICPVIQVISLFIRTIQPN
jgi:hypothetical protein